MSTVQGGQGNIVTNGLILNLDAANPRSYPQPYNGTTWQNIAPVSSSLTGSLVGGVAYTGSNNGALVFDGVNDYVNCGDILNYSNNFSVNCWVNISTSGVNPIVSKWDTNILANRFLLFRINSNTLQLIDSNSTTYSGGSVSSNIWAHVSFVINGANSQLYINGLPSGTTFSPTFTIKSGLNLGLCSYSISLNAFLTGNMAITQIYNRSLNPSEVLQNFNATRARFGI
jgi:hypothetical protein